MVYYKNIVVYCKIDTNNSQKTTIFILKFSVEYIGEYRKHDKIKKVIKGWVKKIERQKRNFHLNCL